MDQRDEFAKAALMGICAFSGSDTHGDFHVNSEPIFVARYCYQLASAMMEERERILEEHEESDETETTA